MTRRDPDGSDLSDLIERCCRRDDVACGALYARGNRIVSGVLGRFAGFTRQDRQDLSQDCWESLHRAFCERGKPDGRLDPQVVAYIRQAARNRAIKFLKRKRVGAPSGGTKNEPEDPVAAIEDPGLTPDDVTLLTAAIGQIGGWSPEYRLIFGLKIQGVTTAEIRQELQNPPYGKSWRPTTIDARFHLLRKELSRALGGRWA